jgi:ATP-dependent helicase HrpA
MNSSLANVPLTYPAELPITQRRDEIVEAIRANQVLVITGETGSGKSTQIPKMCMEAGPGGGRGGGRPPPPGGPAPPPAPRGGGGVGGGAPRRVG